MPIPFIVISDLLKCKELEIKTFGLQSTIEYVFSKIHCKQSYVCVTSGNGDAGALASISFLQNPGRNLNSYRSTISRDLNRFENISEIQTDAILSKFWPRCGNLCGGLFSLALHKQRAAGRSENRWVSSTHFGIPFRLPVPFQNRGSSLFIICKLLVQKDFSIISIFVCCDCYMKKNVVFTLMSFAVLK